MSYEYQESLLEKALKNGEITEAEFREEMRQLQMDMEQQAEETAEQAYNDVMGNW